MRRDRSQRLNVAVAAATRRRPVMLGRMLASFAALRLPEEIAPSFVIVENDTEARMEAQIAAVALPGPTVYALEPVAGIPMARNRAFAEAARLGADLLLFVDDDEEVAPDWLVEMIAAYRRGAAELIGGPVRMTPPEPALSRWQIAVHRGMTARLAKKEARARALTAADGTVTRVTVVTNNWLCDMRLYRELGLRFDESLRFTGGSDAKFCRDARAQGAVTGWAPDALVYETVPAERLTLGYQYARGRDQSNASMRRKLARRRTAALGVAVSVPLKALGCLALLVSLPVTRDHGVVALFRQAGWITGRIKAVFGRDSALYTRPTGY